MDKNKKAATFLTIMGVMCILMLVLYMNFLHDKPLIDNQNQQQLLSPDQMVNNVKQFVNDTTSTIKPIPLKP